MDGNEKARSSPSTEDGEVRSPVNEVFWIDGDPPPGLAIVLRPRGGDWLDDELLRMRLNGVDVLVSMLEPDEAMELGLASEGPSAHLAGLTYLSFPIPDRHVPDDVRSFRQFVEGLAARVHAGERVGVHCRGSIGRSTVVAACALVHLGWKAIPALRAIEAARGAPVPDTPEQHEWICNYEAGS
jgi:protein-tyrosine phosphatase